MIHQCIYKCPCIMTSCGMNYHSLRFVNNYNIVILIYDIQWYIFGFYLWYLKFWKYNINHILCHYLIIWFYTFTIYLNQIIFNKLLDSWTWYILHFVGKILIYSYITIININYKTLIFIIILHILFSCIILYKNLVITNISIFIFEW